MTTQRPSPPKTQHVRSGLRSCQLSRLSLLKQRAQRATGTRKPLERMWRTRCRYLRAYRASDRAAAPIYRPTGKHAFCVAAFPHGRREESARTSNETYLPGFTSSSWRDSLASALATFVVHLNVRLAHRPETMCCVGALRLPRP